MSAPATKAFSPAAGQDQDPDLFIAGNVFQGCRQLPQGLAVEGVQGLGPVEGNGCDTSIVLHFNT